MGSKQTGPLDQQALVKVCLPQAGWRQIFPYPFYQSISHCKEGDFLSLRSGYFRLERPEQYSSMRQAASRSPHFANEDYCIQRNMLCTGSEKVQSRHLPFCRSIEFDDASGGRTPISPLVKSPFFAPRNPPLKARNLSQALNSVSLEDTVIGLERYCSDTIPLIWP